MVIRQIKLCTACADNMGVHYKLTEVQNPEVKRSRCQMCSFTGYLSQYSYDESRPIRDVEGAAT